MKRLGIEFVPQPTFTKTYAYTGVVAVGDVVTLVADGQVSRGAVEGQLWGKVIAIDVINLLCTVITQGLSVNLPYVVGVVRGRQELVVDGAGRVKAAAVAGTGRFFKVEFVDAPTLQAVVDLF